MKWLDDFKLAIINEDFDAIKRLVASFNEQKFSSQDAVEAQALTASAIEILKTKSKHIEGEIAKVNNIKRYMNS
ncbi:hypothetical protein [Campylobacter suis]|uniref:Uncharacterized protein n=1 Tax=Campylobacter suis TaxID=2790657 RepID=A0ABN7K4I6_9BACT|nr:hypothetical protein [Campylobacter suis]CAD7287010.1 hypothetical protein LMG8286_00651 [Campylobacter suis]